MTYLIDAWLDRPHPYLRILHRDTGKVCAVLEEEALDELREQGDLDLTGLNSSEPTVLKELVRNLFLFCYSRALRPSTELHRSGTHTVEVPTAKMQKAESIHSRPFAFNALPLKAVH